MNESKTALIVDDSDQLLRLMVRLVERAGYETWAAQDGDEALRLFRAHLDEIDLALIDVIHPPGKGAADLLPRLLALKPELDVILTSGAALPEELVEMLSPIGGRFLSKPFVPKTLLRMLSSDSKNDPKSGAGAQSRESGVV